MVTYEGGTYVVNTAPPTGTPDTSPDYTLLAAAGATGVTGEQRESRAIQERLESQEQPG
ncbi:hypothetical protein ACEQPO_05685 [Bacillus sp. SL00103]